jgi:hypothetical protein
MSDGFRPLENSTRATHGAETPSKLLDGRAATTRALVRGSPESVSEGRDVCRYTYDEMIQNGADGNPDIVYIRQKLNEAKLAQLPGVVASGYYDAMVRFKSKVGYGQPWDQKKYIVGKWGKLSRLFGVLLDYDVWSNVHYGYVGSRAGFSRNVLLDCAGIAQAVWSEVPSGWFERYLFSGASAFAALDDVKDQEAIKIGTEVAQRYATELTFDAFSSYIKSNMGRVLSDVPDPV